MLIGRACPTLTMAMLTVAMLALALPAAGQSVISTHAGVIYYFDGSVYLGDQPLEPHLGKFPSVPQGAELRTAQGRAEVLLTPGVFLRMGENAVIRLVSNDLANTRVELRSGSAIVDSAEPNSGTSVTLNFRDWQVRSARAGVYRVDSDPPRLWVLKGEAEVVAGTGGRPIVVEERMDLPFASVLVPERSSLEPVDSLSNWARGRDQSIVADNTITQQIDADPATQTASLDSFSYYPFIGLPMVGLSSGPYSSTLLSQPGFYSMYLPGFTYQPLLFGIMARGALSRVPGLPLRIGGVSGGVGGGVGGVARPRPLVPLLTPPAHPMAHPVAHPAIHR